MDLEKAIKNALKSHTEVLVAYLYGSTVKGQESSESDIDVGVLLRDDFEPDALYPVRIAREIEEAIDYGRDVDVRILNDRSIIFLHQVLKNGKLILSHDEAEKVKFESRVYDRYFDYKPYFDRFNELRRRRILQ